ncbi:hypothetical protein B7Y92_00030 [Candidatus Saccharibacteria bacterium 32-50-13]|nr:MAG: hypothetical protein B7Y92_00030 [Candidatus Saccharibacteria bacterium 32-50-13]
MAEINRAAKALIRRESDGRYLVLTCSLWPENPRRSQQPDLPGGTIEPGERIEEGLLREVQEETGLQLSPGVLQLGYCFTRLRDDGVSNSFLLFTAETSGEATITLSWEHESYQWMTAKEVLDLSIRSPYPEMFQHLHTVGLLV